MKDGKLLAQDLACRQLSVNINSHYQCFKQGLACFWNELIVRMFTGLGVKYYHYPHFPDGKVGPRDTKEFCLSSGVQGPSIPQSAQLTQGDSLRLHIQCKVGLKQGLPKSRPGSCQLLSNSSKNTLPFKTPRASLWRWKIDFMQTAPGWKDSQDSCPSCPPQAPPALHHLVPTRNQHPPQLCLFPSGLEGFMTPRPPPSGLVDTVLLPPPDLIPPSFCLMAPRRPLSQSPY